MNTKGILFKMVITCAVVGCRSSWNAFSGISFHRVTKNKKLLPLWQQVVEINISEYAKICSLHFRPEDFVDCKDGKRLKKDAVPSFSNIDMVVDEDSGDEINDDEDNKNLSTLKTLLANSSRFESSDTHAAEIDEDEDDDKNLSTLKELLTNLSNSVPSAKYDGELNGSYGNVKRQPQNFEMVMSCCQPKEMKDVGTQAERKTMKESELQTKVKILGARLARRDAKISYMTAVFQMIKNIVKGTDMEYKLCCELQNIATFSEANESILKKKVSQTQGTEDSLAFVDKKSDEADSSSDDAGACVEVVFSSNLTPRHGN